MIQGKQSRREPARASPANAQLQPAPSEVTLLHDDDLYLFNEGSHFRLYEKLGAHPLSFEPANLRQGIQPDWDSLAAVFFRYEGERL